MSVSDSTYPATFGDGASVLERVLLAIINAHTTTETEGRQVERLQAAMTALIGPVTPGERAVDRALLYMARERQKDACDLEMHALRLCSDVRREPRSIPELATLATREILGMTVAEEVQATINILCNRFRRRDEVHAVEHDHVRVALEAEAVRQVLGELAEWNTPSICPK